jgi:chromosome segregation ATPase
LGLTLALSPFVSIGLAAQSQQHQEPKKIWTNDDLERPSVQSLTLSYTATPPGGPKSGSVTPEHYVRARDPKTYVKQLAPLRHELERIDVQLSAFAQARKGGKGTTEGIDLGQKTQGATTEAETELYQRRRGRVLEQIAEIEDEARRNGIEPGALLSEGPFEESTVGNHEGSDTTRSSDVDSSEEVQTKAELRDENAHLARAKKELDLQARGLALQKRQVDSNPEYLSRKIGESDLVSAENQIGEKRQEIEQVSDKISELEEHLADLKLNSNPKLESRGAINSGDNQAKSKETLGPNSNDEADWRKRFADARYRIHMDEVELDILQQELNVLSLQFDPNPANALRESATRSEINEHRKAISDRQTELRQLNQEFSDLEDDLRRAGGYPGWGRE